MRPEAREVDAVSKQDGELMSMDGRPHGFREYIDEHGFHSLYLITTERSRPVKVGIATDPFDRLSNLQCAHFEALRFHRFWWLPGQPISSRIERAFKQHFAPQMVRGEWFDVRPKIAEEFIETSIRTIGTWGIGQQDMVQLMQAWEIKRVSKTAGRPRL